MGETSDLVARSAEWLLRAQHTSPYALTDAPSGGWATSDAPGAPPDTRATADALIALACTRRLDSDLQRGRTARAASRGANWLLEMQNADGGWPTHSRDDSHPLGGSGIDPTAKVLRALGAWRQIWRADARRHLQSEQSSFALPSLVDSAIERAVNYLVTQQLEDGSFVPLWFGNEHQRDEQNPVLGTAQVLSACADLQRLDTDMAKRAATWLLVAQHTAGGWGPPRVPVDYSGGEKVSNVRSWRENEALAKFCTVEETSAAIDALLPLVASNSATERSISRGLNWLINAIEQDAHREPAILSFYFWRIWYYEQLYPLVLATGTLTRAVGVVAPLRPAITSVG
jgi:squalene-hopene/tetraprenyl-beta-curcumene cyclase